jgi:hypothetical protein
LATFEGTFAEFFHWFDSTVKKKVTVWTKRPRDRLRESGGCQICQRTGVGLQAHHRPLGRRGLVKKALDVSGNDELLRVELKDAFAKIRAAHLPYAETLEYLCNDCHTKIHGNQAGPKDDGA